MTTQYLAFGNRTATAPTGRCDRRASFSGGSLASYNSENGLIVDVRMIDSGALRVGTVSTDRYQWRVSSAEELRSDLQSKFGDVPFVHAQKGNRCVVYVSKTPVAMRQAAAGASDRSYMGSIEKPTRSVDATLAAISAAYYDSEFDEEEEEAFQELRASRPRRVIRLGKPIPRS